MQHDAISNELCERMGVKTSNHSNWLECLALRIARSYIGMTNPARVLIKNAVLLASLGDQYSSLLAELIDKIEIQQPKMTKEEQLLNLYTSSKSNSDILLEARHILSRNS